MRQDIELEVDLRRHRAARHDPAPDGGRSRDGAPRRGYLDWLRGLAVLIMIEAHVIDSWTRGPTAQRARSRAPMILGGFGAPLFLFLAGVAVALSAGSKLRRTGDRRRGRRARVVRRGLEIFGLAFLFRVQAWILGWASPRTLLKVDILNIMGPSIVAAAALWGACARTARQARRRSRVATLAIALLTPIVRRRSAARARCPIRSRRTSGRSPASRNFVFFPWAAFVFAGALLGVLLDAARTGDAGAAR